MKKVITKKGSLNSSTSVYDTKNIADTLQTIWDEIPGKGYHSNEWYKKELEKRGCKTPADKKEFAAVLDKAWDLAKAGDKSQDADLNSGCGKKKLNSDEGRTTFSGTVTIYPDFTDFNSQVVEKLIQNCVQATAPGASVTIEKKDADTYIVTVICASADAEKVKMVIEDCDVAKMVSWADVDIDSACGKKKMNSSKNSSRFNRGKLNSSKMQKLNSSEDEGEDTSASEMEAEGAADAEALELDEILIVQDPETREVSIFQADDPEEALPENVDVIAAVVEPTAEVPEAAEDEEAEIYDEIELPDGDVVSIENIKLVQDEETGLNLFIGEEEGGDVPEGLEVIGKAVPVAEAAVLDSSRRIKKLSGRKLNSAKN